MPKIPEPSVTFKTDPASFSTYIELDFHDGQPPKKLHQSSVLKLSTAMLVEYEKALSYETKALVRGVSSVMGGHSHDLRMIEIEEDRGKN